MNPVLVVGDVGELVQDVADTLGRGGHAVVLAPHAHGSAIVARAVAPAAVVVCLPLADADERRVLRVLRRYGAGTPVLAVARQLAAPERGRLLAAGADVALALRSDPSVLLAELASLPRRRHDGHAWSDAVAGTLVAPAALRTSLGPMLHERALPDEELHVGEIVIRPASRSVRRAGRRVPLTAKEFAVLLCLARRMGQVVTRATLHAEVWGWRPGVGGRSADRQILALRRKLERDPQRPRYLHTVTKFGYRLEVAPGTAEPGHPVVLAG